MGIDWDLVQNHLESYIHNGEFYTLKGVLEKLYHEKDMSPRDMEEFLFGLVSSTAIRSKMKELGIKTKPPGGPNYVRRVSLTFNEYDSNTLTSLAERYKVSRHTIHNFARRMDWPKKQKGKPKK